MSLIDAIKTVAAVAGVMYLMSCGGSPTIPSDVASISSVSTTVNAHTHTVGISSSDQLHPADTTYTSSTDAGHSHTVMLTANQLSRLATQGTVTVSSSSSSVTGNHAHDFTFQGKKT